MVQIIEQEDFGEKLGKSIGSGLSQGANQLLNFKLKQMLSAQKQAQATQAAQNKPFTVFDIQSNLGKLGLDKDSLSILEPQDYEEISIKANEYIPKYGREKAFVMALQEKFNPQTQGSDMPPGLQALQNKESSEEEGLWDVLKKGLESSISGRMAAISRGEGEKSFQERTQLKKGGWFRNLLHSLAKFGGEFPYYGAGGAAGAAGGAALGAPVGGPFGAAVGGTIGGGAGALALPALIETGLQEYQKYLDKGGKGTFGDFIDSASRTLEAGTYGAAEGALLGPLSKLKILDKVPGGKKLLNLRGGKAAQKLIDTGAQAGLFTASKGLAEQRIPSLDEYGQNLGMFLGLDLFHNAGKYSKNIYSQLKKAGIPPKEAAVKIQERVQEKGYDLNNPKDVVRVVKDITAEGSRAGEVARESIKETVKPGESPKETAEKLAERPIEEYIEREKEAKKKKERPPTEREKAKRESAAGEIPEVDRRLEKVQDDVSYLRERLDKGLGKDQRNLAEIALRQKEAELENLRKQREDLKGISEKGVKPFREEDLTKAIDEHIKKVEKAAAAPESPEAKDLQRMFDRDQKYIHRFMELGEKVKLPPAPYKDRFIKILEAYQKAYEGTLKRLENQAKELPKGKESPVSRNLELMRRNYDINKAKIENQKDKLNSLYQLNKPGSALIKQNLKELRKDIKDLQKDFVKQIKLEEASQKKFDNVLRETILKDKPDFKDAKLKNADKVAEKMADKDFTAKAEAEAKKAKINPSRFKDYMDRLKPEVVDIIEAFKKDPSQGINKARKLYRHMPFLYQVAAGSLISAALAEMGVPYYIRFWFIPSNSIIRGLGTGIGTVLRNKYHDQVLDSYVRELADARKRSLGEGMKYINGLSEKLSAKDSKEVIKRYKELGKAA